MELDKRLTGVTPSERQIRFQQTEFYAFIHFTVNTFTDSEWGSGCESADIFDPSKLDAEQWVRAVVAAGMRGLILTCKHHDGFCLWDTKTTPHNVMNSPCGRKRSGYLTAAVLCLFSLGSTKLLVIIYCMGLLYSAFVRIVSAFRKTAIAYIP